MLRLLVICGIVSLTNVALAASGTNSSSQFTLSRAKRQYGCPSNCFSSCNSNSQCRIYQANAACIGGCCCPQEVNLDSKFRGSRRECRNFAEKRYRKIVFESANLTQLSENNQGGNGHEAVRKARPGLGLIFLSPGWDGPIHLGPGLFL